MLLGSISPSVIPSSVISMNTSPSLSQYGNMMIFSLLAFLCLKQILSSSRVWNEYLNNSFNLVIVPLFLCFLEIIAYKIIMNIQP